jgi:hypothetical protein
VRSTRACSGGRCLPFGFSFRHGGFTAGVCHGFVGQIGPARGSARDGPSNDAFASPPGGQSLTARLSQSFCGIFHIGGFSGG